MQYTGYSLTQEVSLNALVTGLTGATGIEGVIISNHEDFTNKNTATTTKNTAQDGVLASLETKATSLETGATGLEGRNATLTSDFVTLQSREDALLAGLTGLEDRAVGFTESIIDIDSNLNGNIRDQINAKVADSIFQSLKTEFEEDFTTFQNRLNQKVVTATQEVIDARQDSDDAVLEKKFCSIEEFAQTFLQTYTVAKPDGTPYNFTGKIQNINKAPPIFSIIEKAQSTDVPSAWDLKIKLTDYGYNVMSGNLVVKNGSGVVVNILVKSDFDSSTKIYDLSLVDSNSSGSLINGPFTFEYQTSTSTAVYSLVLDNSVLESVPSSSGSGGADGAGGTEVLGTPAWGRWIGGAGVDQGLGISAVSDGIYVTGYAGEALTSLPAQILSAMGAKTGAPFNIDAFVIKYNSAGDALWGRWIGGTGIDEGRGISAVSDSNGISSVYVTGRTTGTLTGNFSEGFLNEMGAKPGNEDAFVIKYDSDGEALWGKWIGGTGADRGYGISATTDGIYVTGYAVNSLTGNFPGMGTKPGSSDAFVIKYDSDGEALWGRWIGGTGTDMGLGISATTDSNGVSAVYVTGRANATLTGNFSTGFLQAMGGKPSTVTGNTDAFVIKYDSDGEALWGRWIGGTGTDVGLGISATTDSNGVSAVYVTGYATAVLTSLPDEILTGNFPGMGNNPGNEDAFVIKYNSAGLALWGRWIGGTGFDQGLGISATTDSNGVSAVYVTGYARGALTSLPDEILSVMGGNPGGTNNNDAFVIKYNSDGDAVWGKWIGGTGLDQGLGISATTDSNGVSAVYVTGIANAVLTSFPEDFLTDMGTNPGGAFNTDTFVIKYV